MSAHPLVNTFASFDDLAGDRRLRKEMSGLYRAIFNARGSGEWGLRHTAEQAERHLFEDRKPYRCRVRFAISRSGRRAAGFATAVRLQPDAFPATELPQGFRDWISLEFVRIDLAKAFGSEAQLAYVAEFGVLKRFRKGASLGLLRDLLTGPGMRGVTHVCGWTRGDPGMRALPRFLSIGARELFSMNDSHMVFVGMELKNAVANIATALAAPAR